MLTWLMRRQLDKFQRRYGYDVSYARELLDTDARAFLRYAQISGLSSYRRDVPKVVYYAAKLTTIIAEDCGPCSQLVVAMALEAGLPPATVASIARGDEAMMTDEARLGARFARAVLAHDPAADELRDTIAGRWGQRAVVSLAFAITAARLFPTLKYALGHGKACQRLQVADETIVPDRGREAAMLRATS